jgi:ribonuclease VapC
VISAGTMAEALIVAARRNLGEEMAKLIEGFGFTVADVTPAAARRIADAHDRWGKGIHPAGLNFGDCFAYEVAKERGCALLYVGEDFANTDLQSALDSASPPRLAGDSRRVVKDGVHPKFPATCFFLFWCSGSDAATTRTAILASS